MMISKWNSCEEKYDVFLKFKITSELNITRKIEDSLHFVLLKDACPLGLPVFIDVT